MCRAFFFVICFGKLAVAIFFLINFAADWSNKLFFFLTVYDK